VLVSALIADGPPRRVLELIRDGRLELILPRPALEELERVLRVKLDLAGESVGSIAALVSELATAIVDPPAEVIARSGDRDDDRIIAAALGGGADVLVSGDRKHVLPLDRVGTMRTLRPQDLLAKVLDR
jgi:putative PIN family toxin of toxin-antitoxin system